MEAGKTGARTKESAQRSSRLSPLEIFFVRMSILAASHFQNPGAGEIYWHIRTSMYKDWVMISICLIPYSLCILDAAHDRILSVRTSYSHYFTNCYETTNLRNLLIYHYWSNFYTKYLLRGSFFRYLFSEHSFSEIFEESNIPSLNFQKIILKFFVL